MKPDPSMQQDPTLLQRERESKDARERGMGQTLAEESRTKACSHWGRGGLEPSPPYSYLALSFYSVP